MLTHQLVSYGETDEMAHPRRWVVHFLCITDQSICSNSAILSVTDWLSTGTDVSQFVLQWMCQFTVGEIAPPDEA